MSLLDEARAQSRRPGPKCNVQKALDARPDLAADVAELLRAHDISHKATAKTLDKHELRISEYTVERHRNGDCVTCRDMGLTW